MTQTSDPADETAGILFAGSAYAVWGIVPLYWRLLGDVPPFELTVYRVFWCALFVTAVTFWQGHTSRAFAILRSRRLVATLALTSVLITCNWTLYIYCVATNQLVDASLGYYMTPLVSFAAGIAFFGERMSRLRLAGVALAALAVVIQTIGLGHIPWIAPALALSFGLYGYFRKLAPVVALDGLLVETLILLPFTFALVGYWAVQGTGAFPSHNLTKDALLIGSGPLTAVPLAFFAAGARRIRLTTLGFLQYLSPTITLLLATIGFHEPFTRTNAIAFGCVWAALAIAAVEGHLARLKRRPVRS
ncbi:MAG TPA: EamA family transporter RarD [Rhizomicrobium sp.]